MSGRKHTPKTNYTSFMITFFFLVQVNEAKDLKFYGMILSLWDQ